ncbi:MAG: VOC family protein [Nakamurella sp.]
MPADTDAEGKPVAMNEDSNIISPIKVGLDHVSLRVRDYDASVGWYRDKLDLELLIEWTDPTLPGIRLCHLRLGSSKLELIGNGSPRPRPAVNTVEQHLEPEGVVHLCLTVNDLEAVTVQLAARDVEKFAGPLYVDALDITLILVKDNSGNILEIAQRGRIPATTAAPSQRST